MDEGLAQGCELPSTDATLTFMIKASVVTTCSLHVWRAMQCRRQSAVFFLVGHETKLQPHSDHQHQALRWCKSLFFLVGRKTKAAAPLRS